MTPPPLPPEPDDTDAEPITAEDIARIQAAWEEDAAPEDRPFGSAPEMEEGT